jgi:hypothetical protein
VEAIFDVAWGGVSMLNAELAMAEALMLMGFFFAFFFLVMAEALMLMGLGFRVRGLGFGV